MTDRTTIATAGTLVDIAPHTRGISLTVRLPLGTSHPTCHSILETTALLTAIDAADPDAMRAYLRETLDQLDRSTGAGIYGSRHALEIDSLTVMLDQAVRGFVGDEVTDPDLPRFLALGVIEQLAAERIDAVPEADSPEDVDEHPDPVEQMRESGRQLGEAWRALSDAFREASKGSNR